MKPQAWRLEADHTTTKLPAVSLRKSRKDRTRVDEIVIDDWFHLEAMSTRSCWINIAGVTLWVAFRKDGSMKSVTVYEAGEYDEPREGVRYETITTAPDRDRLCGNGECRNYATAEWGPVGLCDAHSELVTLHILAEQLDANGERRKKQKKHRKRK
jgi:hypothetical protein